MKKRKLTQTVLRRIIKEEKAKLLKESQYKDGIYKSKDAIYFIKDDKILAKIAGSFYKTSSNFMQGEYLEPLKPGMIDKFDKAYEAAPKW